VESKDRKHLDYCTTDLHIPDQGWASFYNTCVLYFQELDFLQASGGYITHNMYNYTHPDNREEENSVLTRNE
jgi:hypothetical protein